MGQGDGHDVPALANIENARTPHGLRQSRVKMNPLKRSHSSALIATSGSPASDEVHSDQPRCMKSSGSQLTRYLPWKTRAQVMQCPKHERASTHARLHPAALCRSAGKKNLAGRTNDTLVSLVGGKLSHATITQNFHACGGENFQRPRRQPQCAN